MALALALSAGAFAQGQPAQPPPPAPLDVNNPRSAPTNAKPAAAQDVKSGAKADGNAAAAAKPGEAAPPAAKPADAKQAEAKPAEAKPAEAKSEEAKQAEATVNAKIAEDAKAAKRAKGSVLAPGMPGECDGKSYPVERFSLEWNTPNDQHPTLDSLMEAEVLLGITPKGYVSPYELDVEGEVITDQRGIAATRTGTNTVRMKLKDVPSGAGHVFYQSALKQVNQAIVDELHNRGIIAVFVIASEDQIWPAGKDSDEHEAGDDLREGKTQDLRLVMVTGEVGLVRTVASGPRLEKQIENKETTRVDSLDRVHARIREQSPVQKGDLVHKDMVDDFLFRLNRHPGRRVDLAVAPGEKPQEVALDYLVAENKPWTAYFQVSNTGTEQTNVWRERFGYVNNQLTGHDDIFRADYITGGFDQANAVNVSYEFPILSDRLKVRGYGGWAEYTASDVGFANEQFEGSSWNGGAELVGTFYQHRELFLDAIAGLKWQSQDVTNTVLQQTGHDDFWTPYLGVQLDRFTDESSTFANITVSANADALNAEDKDKLGRTNVDEYFTVLRFQAEQTMYLEPLFNRLGWFGGKDGKGMTTLAQEVSASVRGQWAMGNRLIPTEEEVAGGLFSVRGYPESLVAGDDVIIASLEYRYHLPNGMGQSEPGKFGKKQMSEFFGRDFRWQPQQEFGRADWDLIFKGFFDFGNTNSNNKETGELADTLISTGLGAELVFKRNVSMRLDWGVALKGAGAIEPGADHRSVQPGDNEWHFLMTLSY